jgi:hypothetical protein
VTWRVGDEWCEMAGGRTTEKVKRELQSKRMRSRQGVGAALPQAGRDSKNASPSVADGVLGCTLG